MQNIQSEKTVSAEYLKRLFDRFEKNNERLFFVDGSKARAFSAVKSLLKTYGCDSQLCIAQDETVASEVAGALGRSYITICTLNDFFDLLARLGVDKAQISDKALRDIAPSFKQSYPNIVIATKNSVANSSVLHARLCTNTRAVDKMFFGKGTIQPPYCISDFLSDCEYEFAIIDNVYEIISLKQEGSSSELKSPEKYEMISFLGKTYYTDIDHSVKRLKKITNNAQKSVIISDLMVDKNAVTMYVALDLIYDSFPYKEAKNLVKSRSLAYNNDCENTASILSSFCSDDLFLSQCMQKNRGSLQITPRNMDEMQKYISDHTSHMTFEEICVKAIYSYAKAKLGLNFRSVEDVFGALIDSSEMALCACEMFFRNALKGELESTLSTTHICDMKKEEINALVSIFNKYGEYFELPPVGDRCGVVRVYREESAFEHAIRAIDEGFDKGGNAYCTSYDGDMLAYKCLTISNMISKGTLKTPMIIVLESKGEAVVELLGQMLDSSYSCLEGLGGLVDAEDQSKIISVIDYNELRRTASFLSVSSIIFFDITADISIFNALLKKSLASGDARAVILADYSDISGHMLDKWGEALLSGRLDPLPIRSNEIFLKEATASDYAELIPQINEIYVAIRELCEGKYKRDHSELAAKIHSLVSHNSFAIFKEKAQMESDFEFFAGISKHYNAVFENSMTIGAHGERVESSRFETKLVTKKKQTIAERGVDKKEEPKAIMFNVCARQLHRSCDVLKNDCRECPYYSSYLVNDFEEFSKGTRGFFDMVGKIARKIEDKNATDDGVLHGNGENKLAFSDVKASENAQRAIERLDAISASMVGREGVFYASYAIVSIIKEAVFDIYKDIFAGYYNQIISIFEGATEKMMKAFTIISKTNGVSHLNNAE